MKHRMLFKMILSAILLILVISFAPKEKAYAEEAAAISFGVINYEALTIQVFNHNNSIVYYSSDNDTWMEIDGTYSATTNAYTMDISWISATSDVTLYFKGDKVKTVKSVTLPMQNSSIDVDYDKVEGEFTFSDAEESDFFEWRKHTDYYWTVVSFDETSNSFESFLDTMETLRTKGAKIIIRTPQVLGTGAKNVGMRPSAEVSITIPARAAAPVVKVYSSKLTINTTSAMEYYDPETELWIECDSNMSLENMAPNVLYENGGMPITLQLRKAATSSIPFSKMTSITIPGQSAAPTIGGNSYDFTYYYLNSKLVFQFNKATATNVYEYVVVKLGAIFNHSTANWKSVTSSTLMTLSKSAAPEGCTIYLRKKGIDANIDKNISLVLSSAISEFGVSY